MDEAALAIHAVAFGFRAAVVDLPLRGPAATSRRRSLPRSGGTTGCLSWSGASQDPVHWSCSFASGALGLRPRRGGTGSGDQSGIDNHALLHGHAVGLEMGFDHLKNLFAEIVPLQEVPEREKRCLIRDPIADQVDCCESAHRRHFDQCILHRWIAEVVPLLQ